MKEAPWSRFAVGVPSNSDCRPLLSVGHVAHVRAALRIVEDAKLRADLVFDKSKLNDKRIRVVWLSPNDWSGAGGFRYGNVRFSFDWEPLVARKRIYWVESHAYHVPACRILITDTDYDSDPQLLPYDPKKARGPWWVSPNGMHYWNGKYCLELMYEGDLPVGRAMRVDLVTHHPEFCSIDARTCSDKGRSNWNAAAEFFGILAASSSQLLSLPGLVEEAGNGPRPASSLLQAHSALCTRCSKLSPRRWGTLRADDPDAPAFARALLRSLAAKELRQDADALASVFQSAEEAERAISDLLAHTAGLASGEVLSQYD